MNNEKMLILKMLEERKISADEAGRLLANLDGTPPASAAPTGAQKPSFSAVSPPRAPAPPPAGGPMQNRPGEAAPKESMADEVSRKFGAFVKDMEPKLKRFAEAAVEKTANAADAISRRLSAPADGSPPPAPPSAPAHQQSAAYARPAPAPAAVGKGNEESIEIFVGQAGAQLNLAGHNGQVLVKGYNGDKISAKIFAVAKSPGARVNLAQLGNKYYLNYDESDFERVCIDAFVPETMFDNVIVSTVNGVISISSLVCEHIKVDNLNGATSVADLRANSITIEQSNGALKMERLNAKTITAENTNGAIAAFDTDAAKLNMTTFNGAIDMQIAQFPGFDDYDWRIETSNERLNLALPSYASLGYHVKAHAALNTVKLGLIGMDYIRNDPAMVEARSINFSTAAKRVSLTLETSNAPLIVN